MEAKSWQKKRPRKKKKKSCIIRSLQPRRYRCRPAQPRARILCPPAVCFPLVQTAGRRRRPRHNRKRKIAQGKQALAWHELWNPEGGGDVHANKVPGMFSLRDALKNPVAWTLRVSPFVASCALLVFGVCETGRGQQVGGAGPGSKSIHLVPLLKRETGFSSPDRPAGESWQESQA